MALPIIATTTEPTLLRVGPSPDVLTFPWGLEIAIQRIPDRLKHVLFAKSLVQDPSLMPEKGPLTRLVRKRCFAQGCRCC